MGIAIAEALRERGAKVTFVHGRIDDNSINGIKKIPIKSAIDMRDQVLRNIDDNDLIIMSAAVSDYRVKEFSNHKIKKELLSSIKLEKNPDILSEIDNKKIIKVGFAAESENLIENAKKKLLSKDCNLIVANDITLEGSGFGSNNNKATLVDKYGCEDLPLMKKSELAHKILDRTIRYID